MLRIAVERGWHGMALKHRFAAKCRARFLTPLDAQSMWSTHWPLLLLRGLLDLAEALEIDTPWLLMGVSRNAPLLEKTTRGQ